MILILCLTFLTGLVGAINPGAVITISVPFAPPVITIDLPQSASPIIVSQLELNDVTLRKLAYSWNFTTSSSLSLTVPQAQISFNWVYKNTEGTGIFIDRNLKLQVEYQLTRMTSGHIGIQVGKARFNIGTSHVVLNGNVKEIISIEVTTLILNQASPLLRGIVEKVLSNAVKSLLDPLGQDIKLTCFSEVKCLYINTTLTFTPILSQSAIVLQINGAPYVTGQPSGYLNPPDVIFAVTSKQISIRFHQKLVDTLITLYWNERPITKQINTLAISSTTEIDSQALTVLFPKMIAFQQRPRDVRLTIALGKPTVALKEEIEVRLQADVSISTMVNKDTAQLYATSILSASIYVKLSPLFGSIACSVRVQQLKLDSLEFNQQALKDSLIDPSVLTPYLPVLLQYVISAINGPLNEKVLHLGWKGITAVLQGAPINKGYSLMVKLV